MLKLIAATAFVGTLAFGTSAMAAENGQRQLSWDQLKQACENPAAFQNQRPPNAIRLTCEDTQLIWEAEQTDSVEMDNSRRVVASLSSDKYYITKAEQAFPMSVSQTVCPRFKEVQLSYTKSFSLSCQEVQAFQGDMANFCHGKINSDLAANKSLATRTETGRAYDMCAAPALITSGKGAPGQQPAAQPAGQTGKAPGAGQNSGSKGK